MVGSLRSYPACAGRPARLSICSSTVGLERPAGRRGEPPPQPVTPLGGVVESGCFVASGQRLFVLDIEVEDGLDPPRLAGSKIEEESSAPPVLGRNREERGRGGHHSRHEVVDTGCETEEWTAIVHHVLDSRKEQGARDVEHESGLLPDGLEQVSHALGPLVESVFDDDPEDRRCLPAEQHLPLLDAVGFGDPCVGVRVGDVQEERYRLHNLIVLDLVPEHEGDLVGHPVEEDGSAGAQRHPTSEGWQLGFESGERHLIPA